MKKQNGITIIALIITIILMLILASVSINVAINGGLFEKAKDAVSSTEIASEKETVTQANILAKSKSKIVTVDDMQKALDSITGENAATAMDNGETIVVKFNKNNRYYEIENSGKVQGPKELVKDEYAGDLSKGNKYDGTTEATAFKITCIEDLVEFSKNYGKYQNSYIKLERTLDFNSIFSYKDYTSKAYGDLNKDGNTDDIRTELTKQGNTCAGFTPIYNFAGTFDGQNNKICNLYQKVTNSDAGLFRKTSDTSIIKNLGLKNIKIIDGTTIGGIVASTGGVIKNCFVEGKSIIKGNGGAIGLIVGGDGGNLIEECYAVGEVEFEGTGSCFGGIVGQASSGIKIKRCYTIIKTINIESKMPVGGIIGLFQNFATDGRIGKIEECYHIGDITTKEISYLGGIAGETNQGLLVIKNCYNIGNITAKIAGGIAGGLYVDIFNCYNVGEITNTSTDWRKNFKGTIISGCYGRTFCTLFCKKRRYGGII